MYSTRTKGSCAMRTRSTVNPFTKGASALPTQPLLPMSARVMWSAKKKRSGRRKSSLREHGKMRAWSAASFALLVVTSQWRGAVALRDVDSSTSRSAARPHSSTPSPALHMKQQLTRAQQQGMLSRSWNHAAAPRAGRYNDAHVPADEGGDPHPSVRC